MAASRVGNTQCTPCQTSPGPEIGPRWLCLRDPMTNLPVRYNMAQPLCAWELGLHISCLSSGRVGEEYVKISKPQHRHWGQAGLWLWGRREGSEWARPSSLQATEEKGLGGVLCQAPPATPGERGLLLLGAGAVAQMGCTACVGTCSAVIRARLLSQGSCCDAGKVPIGILLFAREHRALP